jgi:hypothetical protein
LHTILLHQTKFNSKHFESIKESQPQTDQGLATKMSKHPQESDIYAQLVAKDNTPEPLRKVLAREQADYDCLSCRVMGVYLPPLLSLTTTFTNTPLGATAFGSLGAYTYWSGHRELRTREQEIMRSGAKLTMAARRLGITGLSGMLVGLGMWRAFM